jgi:type VI secretion system protein VasD
MVDNKRRSFRTFILSAVTFVLINGCAGGPPKDIVLEGDLVASEMVNPNRDGRASPVTVVIFHLKGADAFLSKDFFNLYNADSGALASDLIHRSDVQIQPGQTLPIPSEFDPETTHIGVLAAFRDIDNSEWRAIVALPEKGLKEKLNPFSKQKLIVTLDKLSISAEVKKQ